MCQETADSSHIPERLSPARAIALQKALRERVRLIPLPANPEFVAGADVSIGRGETELVAGIVVLRLAKLEVIETRTHREAVRYPYIPGLLSFRELPPLIRLFETLRTRPDILVVDGHGLAHPRRFGLACHAGVALDLPAFGCAKTPLVGDWREPARRAGSRRAIRLGRETVGLVYRTRDGVKPVFLSPGHLCDLPSILGLMPRLCAGYRLPEPTRLAHHLVYRARHKHGPHKQGD